MPQTKTYKFEGRTFVVPADATMEEVQQFIEGGQVQPQVQPRQPQAVPSRLERVKSLLPDPRTALRVGGGLAGGAIGALGGTILGTPIGGIAGAAAGGAAGSSIGESVYQIAGRLRGRGPAPDAGQAALSQASALGQGALQEALPVALLSKGPQALLRSGGGKVAEAIHPSTLGEKTNIQKVGEKAIQAFPVSYSQSNLLNKLTSKARTATSAVENAYNQAAAQNTRFRSAPIARTLESKLEKITHQGQPIPGMEAEAGFYNQVIDWLRQNPTFTVSDFRKVKQGWDAHLNWYRKTLAPTPEKAKVMEDAAHTVRAAIHNVFPAIKRADDQAHIWLTLRDVLGRTDLKDVGREALLNILPRSSVGASIGGLTAASQGQNVYEGAVAGAVIGALSKTAAWNTIAVKERAMLIRALQSQAGRALIKGGAPVLSGALEEALTPNED